MSNPTKMSSGACGLFIILSTPNNAAKRLITIITIAIICRFPLIPWFFWKKSFREGVKIETFFNVIFIHASEIIKCRRQIFALGFDL
jgi:hypothetical protein